MNKTTNNCWIPSTSSCPQSCPQPCPQPCPQLDDCKISLSNIIETYTDKLLTLIPPTLSTQYPPQYDSTLGKINECADSETSNECLSNSIFQLLSTFISTTLAEYVSSYIVYITKILSIYNSMALNLYFQINGCNKFPTSTELKAITSAITPVLLLTITTPEGLQAYFTNLATSINAWLTLTITSITYGCETTPTTIKDIIKNLDIKNLNSEETKIKDVIIDTIMKNLKI